MIRLVALYGHATEEEILRVRLTEEQYRVLATLLFPGHDPGDPALAGGYALDALGSWFLETRADPAPASCPADQGEYGWIG